MMWDEKEVLKQKANKEMNLTKEERTNKEVEELINDGIKNKN